MFKAQLSVEALVIFAAFAAFLAVLMAAEKSVAADARNSVEGIRAQSSADAGAFEWNILAGDSRFSSLPATILNGCIIIEGSFSCTNGTATRGSKLINGTNGCDKYAQYNSIPV